MIQENYGRKLGMLRLFAARIYAGLGAYDAYQSVQWNHVRRLVFICDGNICRSAYAAARAQEIGLPAVSGGLRAIQDGQADPKAIKMAALRGIELATHRTTPATAIGYQAGDLYLCMEPRHARSIAKLGNAGRVGQVTLLGLWSDDFRPYLQDPYGLCESYWQTCFDLIDSAVRRIALEISASRPTRSDAGSDSSN